MLEPNPIFISIIPIAGAIPSLTPSGIASTIFSLILNSERTINKTPSINTIHITVWNEVT